MIAMYAKVIMPDYFSQLWSLLDVKKIHKKERSQPLSRSLRENEEKCICD